MKSVIRGVNLLEKSNDRKRNMLEDEYLQYIIKKNEQNETAMNLGVSPEIAGLVSCTEEGALKGPPSRNHNLVNKS